MLVTRSLVPPRAGCAAGFDIMDYFGSLFWTTEDVILANFPFILVVILVFVYNFSFYLGTARYFSVI